MKITFQLAITKLLCKYCGIHLLLLELPENIKKQLVSIAQKMGQVNPCHQGNSLLSATQLFRVIIFKIFFCFYSISQSHGKKVYFLGISDNFDLQIFKNTKHVPSNKTSCNGQWIAVNEVQEMIIQQNKMTNQSFLTNNNFFPPEKSSQVVRHDER